MRVVASGVSMGHHGLALPETSVAYESGRVAIAVAETGQRPTVLSLIASGRMRPATGTVTVDGEVDAATLSDRVALVDAVDVSDPQGDLRFSWVVREELVFSGRSASRATVHAVVEESGGRDYFHAPIDEVPAGVRVRALAELAAFRRGVEGLVLSAPDRHGGDPREWLEVALDLAQRGFAVLVVVGAAAAEIAEPLVPDDLRADPAPEAPPVPDAPALADETAPTPQPASQPTPDTAPSASTTSSVPRHGLAPAAAPEPGASDSPLDPDSKAHS